MAWVGPLLQLATAGGFGALVWYFVVIFIPRIEDRHQREREAGEIRCQTERAEARAQVAESLKGLANEVSSLKIEVTRLNRKD